MMKFQWSFKLALCGLIMKNSTQKNAKAKRNVYVIILKQWTKIKIKENESKREELFKQKKNNRFKWDKIIKRKIKNNGK